MSKTKPYKPFVKSGDLVEVTTGDHKGARGNVLRILKKNPPNDVRVVIEGVNMVKKSVRPTQEKPQGGFTELEAPIHISNVKLVESKK
jgi:large subunit ribosomal protein L24